MSVPVSAPSSSSSRPVVVRAISSTASVTRVSKRVSSSEKDRSMRSTSTLTCRGTQCPGPDPQALARGCDRIVGLGHDPHDLTVALLELAHVHDAVGDEDPSRAEDGRLCAHVVSPYRTTPAICRRSAGDLPAIAGDSPHSPCHEHSATGVRHSFRSFGGRRREFPAPGE